MGREAKLVEAIVASGLVTGLITGLVAVVLAIAGHRRDDDIRAAAQQREDEIRSQDRKREATIRDEERAYAEQDKRSALDLQMRLIRDERENDRIVALDAEGRKVAREILDALAALRDDFDRQAHDVWGYDLKRDLGNGVHHASLASTDPDLHEFVTRTLNVIEGMQVAVETAEISENDVCRAQRRVLTEAMGQVGRFAATNSWDRSRLDEVRALNEAVDRGYDAKFNNGP